MRRLMILFCLFPVALAAQNQLVPAPDAVKLRRVWSIQGGPVTADEIGYNIWGGTDITGDSIADFAVYRGSDNTWLFYRGGSPPETASFLEIDSVGSIPPYIANFYGDDRRFALLRSGYAETVDDFTYFYDIILLHALSDGSIHQEPALSIDHGAKEPPVQRFINTILVEDINNDDFSDVAVVLNGVRVGQDRFAGDFTSQVWIYFGGADFGLDTPDVVVRDTGLFGSADNWQIHFADLDGDQRMDMTLSGVYEGVGEMIRFYWGDENSPQSWSQRDPDRDIPIIEGTIGLDYNLNRIPYLEDFDGDGAADLVGSEFIPEFDGAYVYLSSRKNARSRSFRLDDADLFYPGVHSGFSVGPLNCSVNGPRYDMLPLGTRYVSGSSSGPDFDYEAYFPPEHLGNGDAIGRGGPVGDVTGDGWPDYGAGNETYAAPFRDAGIAMIFAGGPYIPFDDPSMLVERYPVAGDPVGLFLWPNPVESELHIAWKGNLRTMPARFAVYDPDAKLIVEGEVDPWRGEAVWQCAGVAAGAYLLVAYDNDDNPIAEARILKR